ncbi:fumarylacetoacetate hydrolase family protein [Plantactinospora sp. S1510]|uniref:Fumarylacetoacetate hydrolase family protein n=1 Tax=Plantactinospora alkalitolerans TaxID=2789879 RepID=A0ABS0GRM0_9ACTN|nr:fumarylacetoacetate hydrolase family protein [Plantactinospora alkalitolerans]MBF9128830.1 fumarylacetoacetate hydrolase family protein [Plantactinospora alkalitolerans]
MKFVIFDESRLGAVVDGGVVDVTHALPWAHDPDPVTAGWWRRLCGNFAEVRDRLRAAAQDGAPVPLDRVRLRAPVLNPSKLVAAASNYAEHVAEMHDVQERTLGRVEQWMMDFDVFLKSPSSLVGPSDDIVLPRDVVEAGHEVHHESELVVVIGPGGRDIPESTALEHVFGYAIGLDITVRSDGDRSRRKSYDTFSPVGPWITTSDEAGDPADFDIELTCSGRLRQKVNTSALITSVPAIVSYASSVMTLLPGDVIFTGAPPGVGPIVSGDVLDTSISRLGEMRIQVK